MGHPLNADPSSDCGGQHYAKAAFSLSIQKKKKKEAEAFTGSATMPSAAVFMSFAWALGIFLRLARSSYTIIGTSMLYRLLS